MTKLKQLPGELRVSVHGPVPPHRFWGYYTGPEIGELARLDPNATAVPSGDSMGGDDANLLVTWTGVPPSIDTIHRDCTLPANHVKMTERSSRVTLKIGNRAIFSVCVSRTRPDVWLSNGQVSEIYRLLEWSDGRREVGGVLPGKEGPSFRHP